MKPYGRGKFISGSGTWKKDYHLHKNGRKVESWWEGIADFFCRARIKQIFKENVEKELDD
jgi:hypothetical protein